MSRIRTYSELRTLATFEDRYQYLRIGGLPGEKTFGFDRYLNQRFYKSPEWLRVRDYVIIRDNGCDLGCLDRQIYGKIIIHHMNPMTVDAVKHGDPDILDPEYLITTTMKTHNAIHFSDENQLSILPVDRSPGDTTLWS